MNKSFCCIEGEKTTSLVDISLVMTTVLDKLNQNVMTRMLQFHIVDSLTRIYSSSCRWHIQKRVSKKCWIARRAWCTMAFLSWKSLLEEWPCVFMLLYIILLVSAEILMQCSNKCLWKAIKHDLNSSGSYIIPIFRSLFFFIPDTSVAAPHD